MKTRIGEVEAFEICEERAIKNLPNLGTEVITVLSYGEKHLTGKADEVIGEDRVFVVEGRQYLLFKGCWTGHEGNRNFTVREKGCEGLPRKFY